jgi:4'-phosphopantetheinyl transferase EntD
LAASDRVTVGVLLATSDRPLDPAELTVGELTAFARLPAGPRRRAWLTARRALRQALAGCGRPVDTSDCRFPSPDASLSHSADIAVAAVPVSGPGGVLGVGVDIELDRTAHPGTARFFLTGAERSWLATIPEADRSGALLRLWTVKEALFKADPANASAVLSDYETAAAAVYRGRAVRVGPGGPSAPVFRYVSITLPRGFLTVALAASPAPVADPPPIVDFGPVAERVSSRMSVPVKRLTPDTDTRFAELAPGYPMLVELTTNQPT